MQTNIERVQRTKGFALVELLVAIGIIVILSVSLLFQQNKFDSSIQITNVAYEIATVIRQAQRYGASPIAGAVAVGDTDLRYGVYFDTDTPQTIILFRDVDDNKKYDSGEGIEEYTISGKTVISDIRTSAGSQRSAEVVFARPDPEPIIPVTITIENDGETREIEVSRTGQVQVIQ